MRTAFAASAVNDLASASSMALARNTLGPAPVTATRTPLLVCATNTPTSANREAGCGNLTYADFYASGKLTDVMISSSASAVSYSPLKKSSAAILRLLVLTVAFSATTAAG